MQNDPSAAQGLFPKSQAKVMPISTSINSRRGDRRPRAAEESPSSDDEKNKHARESRSFQVQASSCRRPSRLTGNQPGGSLGMTTRHAARRSNLFPSSATAGPDGASGANSRETGLSRNGGCPKKPPRSRGGVVTHRHLRHTDQPTSRRGQNGLQRFTLELRTLLSFSLDNLASSVGIVCDPRVNRCRSPLFRSSTSGFGSRALLLSRVAEESRQQPAYYPGSKEGHIPTRSASEGSGAFPSLARRVNMQQHAELPCRGNMLRTMPRELLIAAQRT